MRQYETVELVFAGPEPQGSHAAVNLTVTVEGDGCRTQIRGFYAGGGVYKARFLSAQAGMYRWRAEGCVSGSGSFEVTAASEGSHGPVRADGTRFVHWDGSLFHPFGTTVYALVHQNKALIDRTMATLKASAFNKIRLCVFPKHYDYNLNEPEFYPFEKDASGNWDVHHPCFAYWDALEARLKELDGMGIQADLILFHPYDRWGFDELPQQDNLVYLDYLLRRLSALPNLWWSLANEYNLSGKKLSQWEEIEEFVARNDPFGHLLSCHNCFHIWDASRPNVTHVSVQTKVQHRLEAISREYKKPVMLDECGYEGNLPFIWGSLSAREMTSRFWKAIASGAYCTHGETFLDDETGVIWWSRGGELKGESVPRIAFLRGIVESLPGHIEGEKSFWGRFILPPEEREQAVAEHPRLEKMLRAFWAMEEDMADFASTEHSYQGRIGDECFLYYYADRCCGKDTLRLPEGRKYRAEIIDAWNMTRETIAEGISGQTEIRLPGCELIAVLVTAME